jgi:hypothetical protein
MPELPDVEIFERYLDATSLQVTIEWEAKPHKLLDSFLLSHRREARGARGTMVKSGSSRPQDKPASVGM